MRRLWRSSPLAPALVVACAAVGCGGSAQTHATTASAQAAKAVPATPAARPHCRAVAAPTPKGNGDLTPPKSALDPKKAWTAVVETSCGSFTITLDVERAPKTTASFASLARQGFYDGLTFDRIVPGYVIQGGDPALDTTGDPGYSVREQPPSGLRYTPGTVAMAKTGIDPPGTSGSSFFVVTGDASKLPADYALLGRVTAGADVVSTISAVPNDPGNNNLPLNAVVIEHVTIAGG